MAFDKDATRRAVAGTVLLELANDRYIKLGTANAPQELDCRQLNEGDNWLAHLLCARETRFLQEHGRPSLKVGTGLLRAGDGVGIEAPVILAPARLKEREGGFCVEVDGFEAEVNPALCRVLFEEFGLNIASAEPTVDGVKKVIGDGFSTWSVTDEAVVACMDTAAFDIRRDLERRAPQVAKHALYMGSAAAGSARLAVSSVDDLRDETPLLLPHCSDRSVRNAVRLLNIGENVLLTGDDDENKTRAAANAACHFLAVGKTVYYAAESAKLADDFLRLAEKAGIGDFALRLPAGDVAPRLRSARELRRPTVVSIDDAKSAWARYSEQKRSVDEDFDAVMRVRSAGLRFYELVDLCAEYAKERDGISFSAEDAASLRHDSLTHRQSLVEELAKAAEEAGGVVSHPLREINRKLYSRTLAEETQKRLSEAARMAGEAETLAASLALVWNLPKPVKKRECEQLCSLAEAASRWDELPTAWLTAPDMAAFLALARDIVARGKRVADARARLLCTFVEPALTVDAQGMMTQWTEAEARIMTRGAVQGKIIKELTPQLRHGVRLDKKQVLGLLTSIAAYQREQAALVKLLPEAGGLLSSFWKDVYTDWSKVDGCIRAASAADEKLMQALGSREACTGLYSRFSQCDMGGAKQFARSWRSYEAARDAVFSELEVNDAAFDTAPGYAENCKEALLRYDSAFDRLRTWIAYRLVRNQAADAGLTPVIDALEGGMSPNELTGAYMKGEYLSLLNYVTGDDGVLNGFYTKERDRKLFDLCEMERAARSSAMAALPAELAARRPTMRDDAPPYSEEGILVRAADEGRAGIDTLSHRLPTLLSKVFPLVLGSPGELARARGGAFDTFDLVIADGGMDEQGAVSASVRGGVVLAIDRADSPTPLRKAFETVGAAELRCSDETGRAFSPKDAPTGAKDCAGAFLRSIADALSPHGWRARFDVGSVDMALYCADASIKTPVLGVVCDGESMRERSFSDRETVELAALRESGWRIASIYCEEWRSGEAKLRTRLLNRLAAAKREANARRDTEEAENKAALSEKVADEKADANEAPPEETPTPVPIPTPAPASTPTTAPLTDIAAEPEAEVGHGGKPSTLPPVHSLLSITHPKHEGKSGDGDAEKAPCKWQKARYTAAEPELTPVAPYKILSGAADALLREKLSEVIKVEAPVSKPLLLKRVLASLGAKRAGTRFLAAAEAVLADVPCAVRTYGEQSFYYADEEQAETYSEYRGDPENAPRREADELPPGECANAVCAVLSEGGTLTAMNLAREAARLMGYQRLGVAVESAMLNGVLEAWRRKDAASADGIRFSLNDRD